MKILMNGQERDVAQGIFLQELIGQLEQELSLSSGQFVVAVDESLVAAQNYAQHQLKANSRIEILSAMVGG